LIIENFTKASENMGAKVKIDAVREYDGFKIDENEIPMKIAKKALGNMGIASRVLSTGGGSDINIFNSKGKVAVNLSSGMENVHTNSEFVKVEQLKKLAALIIELCTVRI